jgi:pilus assembly protein CpaC
MTGARYSSPPHFLFGISLILLGRACGGPMVRAFLLLVMIFYSLVSRADSDLILKVGDSQTLPSMGKAWVENRKVIRLEETAKGFVVKGLKAGKSLLKIDHQIRVVHVLSLAQEETLKILRAATARTVDLSADLQDGEVVVQGNLLRWKDLERLFLGCRQQNCVYRLMAKSSPEMRNEIENHLQELLKAEGLSPQNILFGNGYRVLLNEKSELLSRLKKFFSALGFEIEMTKESLDLVPVVKVQITVAEIDKDHALAYGLQWPKSASAQVLPFFGSPLTTEDLVANFVEVHHLGKILASPNLLCRSGEEARFLAGGEFPIKIVNINTRDVIWKQYGILLTVKPRADLSGKISLSVQTEVSKITGDLVDGIPSLQTNRVESHVDLTKSQMIALSGLIRSDEDQKITGLPGLGKIPILGPLFASKDFQERRTELVIFLKPEIVDLTQGSGS